MNKRIIDPELLNRVEEWINESSEVNKGIEQLREKRKNIIQDLYTILGNYGFKILGIKDPWNFKNGTVDPMSPITFHVIPETLDPDKKPDEKELNV